MSQAGDHLPTLSSHGWGCSHLLGATNLPEHYRVVWDPAHHTPVPQAGESLGVLEHPWDSEGADGWNVSLDSKGRQWPPALQHWVVGKGWRTRSVPQGKGRRRGEIHGQLGELGRWERQQGMRGTGG